MKTCAKCQEQKEPSNFPLCVRYSDGLFPYCKECRKESGRQSYKKHAEKCKASVKLWQQKNRGKVRDINNKSARKHKEKRRAYSKLWYEANKEERNKQIVAQRHTEDYKSNVVFRIRTNLRARFKEAIIGRRKGASAVRDLGCSVPEFKLYLESLWLPGMTWDNWSFEGWHIDHIKPLSKFDLTDEEQQKQAVHYTNLQPLWAKDNMQKHNKF